jgi:hypothetical protein
MAMCRTQIDILGDDITRYEKTSVLSSFHALVQCRLGVDTSPVPSQSIALTDQTSPSDGIARTRPQCLQCTASLS